MYVLTLFNFQCSSLWTESIIRMFVWVYFKRLPIGTCTLPNLKTGFLHIVCTCVWGWPPRICVPPGSPPALHFENCPLLSKICGTACPFFTLSLYDSVLPWPVHSWLVGEDLREKCCGRADTGRFIVGFSPDADAGLAPLRFICSHAHLSFSLFCLIRKNISWAVFANVFKSIERPQWHQNYSNFYLIYSDECRSEGQALYELCR